MWAQLPSHTHLTGNQGAGQDVAASTSAIVIIMETANAPEFNPQVVMTIPAARALRTTYIKVLKIYSKLRSQSIDIPDKVLYCQDSKYVHTYLTF